MRLLLSFAVLLGLGLAVADAHPRNETSYVLLGSDGNTSMSGDRADVAKARKLRHGSERLLWFRSAGSEYVVRDPATLSQAEAIWKPVSELGDAMGKLGDQQGALGDKQGKLGDAMGKLGDQQGALGSELGDLAARTPATAAERKQIERRVHDIEREMHALDGQMRALQDQMKTFEPPMRELGKQMEALGKQMEAASKKAAADFDGLLARAIASGVAQRT